ncbi:MAG: sigma-54-dependent transcriptional regulator [Thermoanaerobaculia bacterium]
MAESTSPRILVVEDDDALRRLLLEEIEDLGWTGDGAASAEEALERLDRTPVDVVVSDLRLPGLDGMELLERVRQLDAPPSFVVITAFGTVPQAVAALKAGADEFLTKPLDLGHLRLCLERILDARSLREEVRRYRELFGQDRFYGMVGASAAMEQLFEQITRVGKARGPVLILGESGTGKELAARAVHEESGRRGGPFVAVNCAGIPHELMESELFGHREGAFTGARRDRAGLFQEADGGTLLLDEVAEMPAALQAKLLRVLQDGEVRPVGADRNVAVDARILAASHQDLEAAVEAGRFREDLFYRLETFRLHVPPLRERGDDLVLLAVRFLGRFSQEAGGRVQGFSPEALETLRRYPFPGNVRELQNAVERAVAYCDGAEVRPEHLPARIRRHGLPASAVASAAAADGGGEELPTLAEVETRHIRRVLERLGGNKRQAARTLGISRRTLYRKLGEA